MTVLSSLFTPADKTPRSRLLFWLLLSLVVAAICPILALQKALSSEFVVQDDARQHVFWMSRFVDPALFPGDLIADYFQSVAPWGYASFYHLFAEMGLPPLLLHRCLPIVLCLIATAYAFAACLQLLPVPFAGFLTALLLNQSLWMRDDIISSTPVAFVYPLFFAFLYYLLRRSLLPCLVTIALQGLFYPQCVLIYAGVLLLRLVTGQQGLRLVGDRKDYWLSGLGLGVVLLMLLPYALQSSAYGPVLTGAATRNLFTLSPQGWSAFFNDNPLNFWLCGKRSGMLPFEWCTANSILTPEVDDLPPNPLRMFLLPHIWLALSLPFLLRSPHRFPLAQRVTHRIVLLPQVLLISIALFLIAHALIFQLHLPNRYTEHSFRIIAVMAAGVALTIGLDALLRWSWQHLRNRLWTGATVLLAIVLLAYPVLLRFEDVSFPVIQYSTGRYPELYRFFAQQPKDSVIASIDREIANVPSFSRRSILVGGRGFVLPYHLGYYREISQRTIDLLNAQYSPDLADVQQFIQKYSVDFWLLQAQSFKPKYLQTNPVFKEFADTTQTLKPQFRKNATVALAGMVDRCTVFQQEPFTVVDAACILNQR